MHSMIIMFVSGLFPCITMRCLRRPGQKSHCHTAWCCLWTPYCSLHPGFLGGSSQQLPLHFSHSGCSLPAHATSYPRSVVPALVLRKRFSKMNCVCIFHYTCLIAVTPSCSRGRSTQRGRPHLTVSLIIITYACCHMCLGRPAVMVCLGGKRDRENKIGRYSLVVNFLMPNPFCN